MKNIFKISAVLFLVISLVVSSCKKEEDTIALIRVVDIDGVAIEQVLVSLFPEPSDPQNNELIDEVEQQFIDDKTLEVLIRRLRIDRSVI